MFEKIINAYKVRRVDRKIMWMKWKEFTWRKWQIFSYIVLFLSGYPHAKRGLDFLTKIVNHTYISPINGFFKETSHLSFHALNSLYWFLVQLIVGVYLSVLVGKFLLGKDSYQDKQDLLRVFPAGITWKMIVRPFWIGIFCAGFSYLKDPGGQILFGYSSFLLLWWVTVVITNRNVRRVQREKEKTRNVAEWLQEVQASGKSIYVRVDNPLENSDKFLG